MIYQDSRFLVLQTNHYSYVISLNAPAPLGIYWGPKIDARDAECLHPLNDRSSFEQEMWRASLEYPAFDGRTFGTVALQAERESGSPWNTGYTRSLTQYAGVYVFLR